jgi:hypothetical protein
MSLFAHAHRHVGRRLVSGAVLLALWLLSSAAARAASCTDGVRPLQFSQAVTTLPAGTVGETYDYTLRADGGVSPYRFYTGSPPPGLTLSADGTLKGSLGPLPAITTFTASVSDRDGCVAQQKFRLVIRPVPRSAPAHPPKPSAPPSAPEQPHVTIEPAPLTTIPLADTLATPPSDHPTMDTYRLTGAIFKNKTVVAQLDQMATDIARASSTAPALDPISASSSPPATGDSPPGDDASGPDAGAQFKRLIQPLIGVDYPGRDLFEAALDARLCSFSASLIQAAARRDGKPAPDMSKLDCPPDWKALADRLDYQPVDPVPWQEVPLSLMSPSLHDTLIEEARQPHDLLDPAAPSWSGAGCGCVGSFTGDVYGFYPFWVSQGQPQAIDFSLLTRIGLFALWYRNTGDLVLPAWKPAQTNFIVQARRHRTQLDYTLYRNDWTFLKDASDVDVTRISTRLATQAADFIDTPLADVASRIHAWVPGFAKVEYTADGLVFFPDQAPPADAALGPAFKRYVNEQIKALIDELRKRRRQYVLHIVLRDSQLEGANSVWKVDALDDYVKSAEDPPLQDGHIVLGSTRYRSHTNLTLRYLVLLTDPTGQSTRSLRAAIDQDANLDEDDRRVLLRKITPVVSAGKGDRQEVADQMAYFADNFGGIGFWPVPPHDLTAGHTVSSRIRASFSTPFSETERFRGWICVHRWPLRIAFEALLLLWLIAFLVYRTACRFRRLSYQLALLVGAVGILILGALLLAGDPALRALREGNALLGVLLVALIATIAYHMLKPWVEKP